MLNTANYVSNDGVLRAGDELEPASLEELKKPGCKVYFHRVPGAITHMPDGAQITFRGGMFATTNEDIQNFLDKITDKPTSQVYTKKQAVEAMQAQETAAALAAMVPAGDQRNSTGEVDSTVQVDPATLQAAAGSQTAAILKPGVLKK